jgi:site-specific DNA-cytosine methylase
MKLNASRQIFEKYSNIKFHGYPSSRSRVFPCGRTDRQQTDVMRLTDDCRDFVNAPKTNTKRSNKYTYTKEKSFTHLKQNLENVV